MSALPSEFEQLDREARVPLVPGDLNPWCQGVLAKLVALECVWRPFERDQREVNEQILRNDPELARRVELLEQRRHDAQGRQVALRRAARDLIRRTAVGSSEPTQEGELFRRQLLEWIDCCRKLVEEQRTWLVESHYRDRGEAD